MAKAYLITCYHSIKNPRRSPPTRRSPAPRCRRQAGASSCAACRRRPTRTGSTSARWWWNSTSLERASPAHDGPGYQEALRVLGNAAERDVRLVEGVG